MSNAINRWIYECMSDYIFCSCKKKITSKKNCPFKVYDELKVQLKWLIVVSFYSFVEYNWTQTHQKHFFFAYFLAFINQTELTTTHDSHLYRYKVALTISFMVHRTQPCDKDCPLMIKILTRKSGDMEVKDIFLIKIASKNDH